MISFIDLDAACLKLFWLINVLRCQTSHTLKFLTYQYDESRAVTVRIAIRVPEDSETFSFSGQSANGLGEAFSKAFNEFLEADFFWKLNLDWRVSRSGFAAAVDQSQAINRAYAELIERDAFLQHFFVPSLKTESLPIRHEAKLIQLQSSDDAIAVAACGTKNLDNGRWMIGLGTGSEIEAAAEKAVVENRMLRASFKGDGPVYTPKALCLMNHLAASGTAVITQRLDSIFDGGGSVQGSFRTSRSNCKILSERRYSSNRYVVRCAHDQLLPLTFGELWLESEGLILDRLRARGFTPLDFSLHPIL